MSDWYRQSNTNRTSIQWDAAEPPAGAALQSHGAHHALWLSRPAAECPVGRSGVFPAGLPAWPVPVAAAGAAGAGGGGGRAGGGGRGGGGGGGGGGRRR